MKILLTVISALLLSFSVSKSQPTVRDLKELIVAQHAQNKELTYKLTQKDTIIQEQDTLLKTKDERISSLERKDKAWIGKDSAYRESLRIKDDIIDNKQQIIKKKNRSLIRLRGTVIGLGVVLAVITFEAIKED
jgi:hypothetical protein